jgi:hypothetical protein
MTLHGTYTPTSIVLRVSVTRKLPLEDKALVLGYFTDTYITKLRQSS